MYSILKTNVFGWGRLLLFGVTSYTDMPAYTGFRDLIHNHVALLLLRGFGPHFPKI